jgi:hypothetical protein
MENRGVIKVTFAGLIFLLIFIAVIVVAGAAEQKPVTDKWEFKVTPYLWAPAIDADTTVSGQTAESDMSFGDIVDAADTLFGLMARVEAWKGKWGLIFDGMYIDVTIKDDAQLETPPANVGIEVEIAQSMLEFAVSYRVAEVSLGDNQDAQTGKTTPTLRFEPIAGLRYNYLKQEIDLNIDVPGVGSRGTTLGGSEEWFDPFVGGRILLIVNEKLNFGLRGDVGGFGIGDASDLAWNLILGVGYQPWQRVSLKLAYRVYDLDYETGSGKDTFGFDGQMKGPMFGATIYF